MPEKEHLPATRAQSTGAQHLHEGRLTLLFSQERSVELSPDEIEDFERQLAVAVEKVRQGDLSNVIADLEIVRSWLLRAAGHWSEQAVKSSAPTTALSLARMSAELVRIFGRLTELEIDLARPRTPSTAVQVNLTAPSAGEVVVGGDDV